MEELKAGMTCKCIKLVKYEDTAISYDSGALAVFATPAMVSLMEKAAFTLAKEKGVDTVGTGLNIQHLRACKVGTEVYSIATITGIDGKRIEFDVEVFDNKGILGKGTHTRYIISDTEKFMSRL